METAWVFDSFGHHLLYAGTMIRIAQLSFCLVYMLVASGTLAQLPADNSELRWKPEWRRMHWVEYTAIPVLFIGLFAIQKGIESPQSPHWTGGLLLDEPIRNASALSEYNGRIWADKISDFTWYSVGLYPLIIDALLVSLVIHDSPDVAAQLAVMDAQAVLINGVMAAFSQRVVGRERPFALGCDRKGDHYDPSCTTNNRYRSFFSGHTSLSFTGAGLICVQHQYLDLYGGGAADTAACISALTLATATGTMRILADRHWFSDVLFGAGLGLFTGWIMPWLLHFRKLDDEKSAPSATFVPVVGNQLIGLGYWGRF